jgi:hypothetical protein
MESWIRTGNMNRVCPLTLQPFYYSYLVISSLCAARFASFDLGWAALDKHHLCPRAVYAEKETAGGSEQRQARLSRQPATRPHHLLSSVRIMVVAYLKMHDFCAACSKARIDSGTLRYHNSRLPTGGHIVLVASANHTYFTDFNDGLSDDNAT